MHRSAQLALGELLSRPEGTWSLTEGALAIARLGHESPDALAHVATLEELGRRLRERAGQAVHPRFRAGALARLIFDEEGFVVPEDLDPPERYFLDAALAERKASPTLLALILLETARHGALRLEPVDLQGWLFLRARHNEQCLFFDPRRALRSITLEEIAARVAPEDPRPLLNESLRPVSPTQVLARIVANLKMIFLRKDDHANTLAAIELLLTIRPDDPREIRDRGRILFMLGRLTESIRQLETYLAFNPRGEDAEAVRLLLEEARAGLRR